MNTPWSIHDDNDQVMFEAEVNEFSQPYLHYDREMYPLFPNAAGVRQGSAEQHDQN